MPSTKAYRTTAGLAGLALVGASLAFFAPSGGAAQQPASAEPIDLTAACTAEAAQVAAPAGVTVKQIVNGPRFTGGVRLVAASGTVPAFCQVSGSFTTNPASGKTANFMATFPANWNGKYLQLGCSGHCGQFAVSDPAQAISVTTMQGYPLEAIIKGYATFATDEGHQGMQGGTWADKGPGQVDEEAITDFFYRADKVLAQVGKQFTVRFYGQQRPAPPHIARSYFTGCSGGGRDAFVAASYFPEEFDGIIGGSAYDSKGAAFQFAGLSVASLRPGFAPLTADQLKIVDNVTKAQCDGLDGVKDGIIQNPAACNFKAERDLPRCEAGAPAGQCFSAAQIEMVSAAQSAVRDEDGHVVQPGYTLTETQAITFRTPKRPADPDALEPFPGSDTGDNVGNGYWPLADSYLKLMVHKNDPNFHTRSVASFRTDGPGGIEGFHIVVPRAEVARVADVAKMAVGHFPANADRLIRDNRKFLIWHNLSDEILTPYMSINYYKQLAARHGGYARLQRNVRLFGIPGSGHCSMSGVGPNNFDALTAMENWVEKGIAPDALPAALYPTTPPYGMKQFDKPPLRTMPLCKFPEMARYSGRGDVKDAKNWSCAANDRRMLTMGASGIRAGVVR